MEDDANGRAGTIFRPKKASYAPAGYQNDHIDLVLPRKRSISASCETDTRALDSQGLAALAGALDEDLGLAADQARDGTKGCGHHSEYRMAAMWRKLTRRRGRRREEAWRTIQRHPGTHKSAKQRWKTLFPSRS